MLITLYIIIALVIFFVFLIFINAIRELDKITVKNILIAVAISFLVPLAVVGEICQEIGSGLVEKLDD